MITIIVPEHKEKEFIEPMLHKIEEEMIDQDKELILITSAHELEIKEDSYTFQIRIITDVKSSAGARNAGAEQAEGDTLFFCDAHCCFDKQNINLLLYTLKEYPNAAIVPGIQPTTFPECEKSEGIGYGVYFDFSKAPFKWCWMSKEKDSPYRVPFGSACAFIIRKNVFWESLFGFLDPGLGVGFEEELFIRLAALGHPTMLQPQSVIGHLFKKAYLTESIKGHVPSRAIATVLNASDSSEKINKISRDTWGTMWDREIGKAFIRYAGYRNYFMEKRAKDFSEEWYFRGTNILKQKGVPIKQ